jgi:hypothetical protein
MLLEPVLIRADAARVESARSTETIENEKTKGVAACHENLMVTHTASRNCEMTCDQKRIVAAQNSLQKASFDPLFSMIKIHINVLISLNTRPR